MYKFKRITDQSYGITRRFLIQRFLGDIRKKNIKFLKFVLALLSCVKDSFPQPGSKTQQRFVFTKKPGPLNLSGVRASFEHAF